jgi:predicted dehydrogenase
LAVSGATHSEMAKDMKEYAYVNMWAGPPDYNGTFDVEDYVTGLIRMKNSTINVNGAWAQNIGENAMNVEFLGDRGGIKLQYGGDFKVYTSKNGVLYETIPSFAKSDMFYDEIDGFLQSVKSGVKNRANIDQAILTSRVMDALYESAAAGGEVKL